MKEINMPYKLFLDDDAGRNLAEFRDPPAGELDWKIAHSSNEAMELVRQYGIPIYMDLDHDLGQDIDGNEDTAMDFLRRFSQTYPQAINHIEGFNIHSQNPVGRENIKAFMKSWKQSQGL